MNGVELSSELEFQEICPLQPLELQKGVRFRLREVSDYRRL